MTLYWDWVKSEAALVNTDGCSAVSGVHVECCYEHDLAYRLGKDPRAAFRLSEQLQSNIAAWAQAPPITRREADARFRQCLQTRSRLGLYSPLAWWRWAGVRLRAGGAWKEHRQREQQQAAET